MNDRRLIALALLGWLGLAGSAAAEEQCGLKRVAQMEATTDRGPLLIHIQIDGHDAHLMMDTGSPFNMITGQLASQLNLPMVSVRDGAAFDATGKPIRHMVHVHKVGLGGMTAEDVPFLIYGEATDKLVPFDGVFGANFLEAYDVELDLAHNKVNLFLKDHCPGQVVYWTQDYDVIPFVTDASLHAVFHVTLDGQELRAMLDTGATPSILSAQTARQVFNLDPAASGQQPDGYVTGSSGNSLPFFRHSFSSLEIGGVAFRNTELKIVPDKVSRIEREHIPLGPHGTSEENLSPAIIVGLHHLARIRAYIAFGEQKLYISAADAH